MPFEKNLSNDSVGLNNRRNLGQNNCCIASNVYNKRNMPESSAIRLTKGISLIHQYI